MRSRAINRTRFGTRQLSDWPKHGNGVGSSHGCGSACINAIPTPRRARRLRVECLLDCTMKSTVTADDDISSHVKTVDEAWRSVTTQADGRAPQYLTENGHARGFATIGEVSERSLIRSPSCWVYRCVRFRLYTLLEMTANACKRWNAGINHADDDNNSSYGHAVCRLCCDGDRLTTELSAAWQSVRHVWTWRLQGGDVGDYLNAKLANRGDSGATSALPMRTVSWCWRRADEHRSISGLAATVCPPSTLRGISHECR